MKLYTCTNFEGHYPVGTAAVVVATDKAHAFELLAAELARLGLKQSHPLQFNERDMSVGAVFVLNDGNY